MLIHLRLPTNIVRFLPFLTLLAHTGPAAGAEIYELQATNVSIDDPSPLFTSTSVTGSLTLADTVSAGSGFNLPDILDFSFNFAGIEITLADTMLPGGDITAFGERSIDGNSLSLVDMRFDLPSTLSGCSFICAGQIEIGTFDQSNFVAIDDPDAATTSLVIFDAALDAEPGTAPEPGTLALFGAGLAGLAAARKRGKAVLGQLMRAAR